MNKVFLIGRLTRDPELNTTSNGVNVCRFSLAVDRTYKNANGDKETDFIPVVVWRAQAETCSRYLVKGQQCAVSGSMQVRNYDDKEGIKRTVTEVVADNVEFLAKPTGGNSEGGGSYNGGGSYQKKPAIDELQPIEDDGQLPF